MTVELDVAHPVLLGPGEGERLGSHRGDRTILVKAEHELLNVTESFYAPRASGASPHIHRGQGDAFYVLEGELVFKLGPKREPVRGPAGTLMLAPAGLIHGFDNEADAPARFLNIHAPGMRFVESLRVRRRNPDYDPEEFDTFSPPDDGGRPRADAIVRGPGEGEPLSVGTSSLVFKVQVGDGDGTFSLSEMALAPGFPGPVPHRHSTLADSFYVLEGTLTVRVGDATTEAPAGSYAFVPPGNVHTFANRSDTTVRTLNLMAPGGFEQYLKEVAAAAGGGPPDPAAMAEIASRYDFVPA